MLESIKGSISWHVDIKHSVREQHGAVGRVSDSSSVDACQSWVQAPAKAPLFPWARNLTPNA